MYSPFSHEVSNTMTKKKNNKQSRAFKMAKMMAEVNKIKNARKPSKPRPPPTPFSDVGQHIGSMFGFKDFGRGIGGVIGRILGSGDYTTNFDSVRNNALTSPVPAFGMEDTVITHREYVKDIISSSTPGNFKIESFRINPVNDELFQWLGPIANCFEEYTIMGMIFEFKTTSGQSVASTNTSLGTVIIATQYDPLKPAFNNKQQMENYFFAQSTVPSQSMLHAIECKEGSAPLKKLYTTTTGGDVRFQDFGSTYVATQGLPGASVNTGELWVSYKIKLSKPRLSLFSGNAGSSTWYQGITVSSANPLGAINFSRGSLGATIFPTSIFVEGININQVFMISFIWSGSGPVVPVLPAFTYTHCTVLFSDASVSTGLTIDCSLTVVVQANSELDSFLITLGSAGTLPTGANNVNVIVTAIEPGVF